MAHNPDGSPEPTAENDWGGEGARPSSLIPFYKFKVDRAYLLQLNYAVERANEETVRKYGSLPPGGLPVQKKTKPNVPYRDLLGNLVPEIPMIEEEDEMKFKQMAAIAALAMGTAACNSATSAGGSVDTNRHSVVQVQPAPVSSVRSSNEPTAGSQSPANAHKPMLGPEYKKIDSFFEFRKKLLADGWKPVVNPNCRDAVLGADHENFCKAYATDVGCRVCAIFPEIFRSTSDGYQSMHYIKDTTPLNVTVYGDIGAIDEPDSGKLSVIGWAYDDSINVFLLDN